MCCFSDKIEKKREWERKERSKREERKKEKREKKGQLWKEGLWSPPQNLSSPAFALLESPHLFFFFLFLFSYHTPLTWEKLMLWCCHYSWYGHPREEPDQCYPLQVWGFLPLSLSKLFTISISSLCLVFSTLFSACLSFCTFFLLNFLFHSFLLFSLQTFLHLA